jgi:hypothetical protein
MPTIKNVAGPYRLFYSSFDCNEPQHVHVQSDNRLCKFWLEPLAIRNLIQENPVRIMEAWHEHCDQR